MSSAAGNTIAFGSMTACNRPDFLSDFKPICSFSRGILWQRLGQKTKSWRLFIALYCSLSVQTTVYKCINVCSSIIFWFLEKFDQSDEKLRLLLLLLALHLSVPKQVRSAWVAICHRILKNNNSTRSSSTESVFFLFLKIPLSKPKNMFYLLFYKQFPG